jgi:hypothetical protein
MLILINSILFDLNSFSAFHSLDNKFCIYVYVFVSDTIKFVRGGGGGGVCVCVIYLFFFLNDIFAHTYILINKLTIPPTTKVIDLVPGGNIFAICGTSAGALTGGFIAKGIPLAEIEKEMCSLSHHDFW